MIDIRRVTHADQSLLEALQPLVKQLNPTMEATLEQAARMVSDERCRLYVAEKAGEVVGMLTLVYYDTLAARRAWIEDVVTREEFRGQGVGRQLVQQALKEARKQGVETLSLTSSAHRKAAHALYRSVGFKEADTTLFRLLPKEE